ncbi:MAG: ABC transporter ATP-binding protein [Candidatus Atribacteria bacterium]|jgi:putative ABC transport system ATP-binding protein|nr:ABC transporter ATP-binding protein [Candidatus Atribacteria bacterium]
MSEKSVQPVIDVRELGKVYFLETIQVKGINNVSFQIYPSDFVSIMGPSGSGKSTLMNILGCLDTPTSGQYLLDQEEVSHLKENQLAAIRNRKIGFVFQNFNLLPKLNAFQNVELPLLYAGIPKPIRCEMVNSLMEKVGLSQRKYHRPNQLSGGQIQRVAIARALANNPSIILADEPTGNLDSRSGEEVMEVFQKLNEQGKTIILVTHEQDIAFHSKRILRFRDGQLEKEECVATPLKAKDFLRPTKETLEAS